jgi:nucleotide-binding universal stress UspA family protein
VSKGDIATTIVEEAKKLRCQLIVLGSKKGFTKKKSLGQVVKGVMRETRIPVLFVPHVIK